MRVVAGGRLVRQHRRRNGRPGRLRRHPVAQLRGRTRELQGAIVVGRFAGRLRGAPQPDDGVDAFATLPQGLGGLETPGHILGVRVLGGRDRKHCAT